MSFFLTELLPGDIRVPIRYTTSRIRKEYFDKPDMTVVLLANYTLSDHMSQDTIVSELQSEFGTNPSGGTRFSSERETDLGLIKEVVNLDPGNTQFEQVEKT